MKKLLLFLCCLCIGLATIQVQAQNEAEKELQQGVQYYQTGQFDKALPIFEKHKEGYLLALKDNKPQLAGYLTILATCYEKTGQTAKAQELYPKIKELQASNPLASPEWQQALKDYQTGQYAKALPIFEKHKDFYLEAFKDNPQEILAFWNALATCYQKTSNMKEYEAILPYIQKQQISKEGSWQALNQEGRQYFQAANYPKAQESWENAKIQAEREFGKSNQNYATSCNNLAELYKVQERFIEAEFLFIEAKSIRAEVLGKNHPDYATSCNNLAELYRVQGRYVESESLHLEAKAIIEKVLGKEHPAYANSCNNLALSYYAQGRYAEAEPLLIEAKNIQEKVFGKKHHSYALSCNNLGELYHLQGLYAKAEPLLIESKNIRAEVLGKNHPDYANSCHNLATLYKDQGLYAKAESLYIEAKAIIEKVLGKEHTYNAVSCNNLAELYQAQGLYEKAEFLYSEAMTIIEKSVGKENPEYASFCDNLAQLYHDQGLYEKAEFLYSEAMTIIEKSVGKENPYYSKSLSGLALLYIDQGLYAKAEPLMIEAIANYEKVLRKEHPAYATSLGNLALLYYSQKLYTKAEPLLLEAKEIEEKSLGKEHPSYVLSCNNLALLYQAQGLYFKAEPLYLEAIQNKVEQIEVLLPTLSEKERESYVKSIQFFFENFYDFAVKYAPQKPSIAGELFNLQLTTKGLIFNSTQKMQAQILSSGNQALIAKYQDWKAKKVYLRKLLETPITDKEKQGISPEKEKALQAEANQLEKELSLQSEAFAQVTDKTRYTWQDVQAKLQTGEALVEIIRILDADVENKKMDTVYIALILRPETTGQPEMVVLDKGKELETKFLTIYKNSIKNQTPETVSYLQYWQPLQTALQNCSKVFVSADGVYHQINLLTLKNPKTGKFLKDEIDIQMVGTSKDLLTQNPRSPNYQSAILFGYPNYNGVLGNIEIEDSPTIDKDTAGQRFFEGNNIKELLGTKLEIENLSAILKNNQIQTQSYLWSDANEPNLKALKNPDILHIATHGFFLQNLKDSTSQRVMGIEKQVVAQNPLLRSGLLFAQAKTAFDKDSKGNEGVLTADEAQNLNLDETSLVVLSACETGLGEIANGEGVYGLQRAFQQAGARTIVMSLWKVSDQVTQEFMTLFYENLLSKKQSKREAFRNAQNTLQASYPAPYYWGAFMMIGE